MNKAEYTLEVPTDRFELYRLILEKAVEGPVKVMVAGGVDSGKTTLVNFLLNGLIGEGLKVAVVDSDVGQKSILPPATVSMGFPEGPVRSLSDVYGMYHYFIGTTSPGQYMGEMVVAVSRLTEMASRMADVTLVDTTGFVSGPGSDLKRLKVEAVRPDFLVLLERGNELETLARSVGGHTRVIRLGVSERARRYSPEERRSLRNDKWKTYFRDSRVLEVDLRKIIPTGTAMFQGRELDGREKTLLSRLFDWIIFAGWEFEKYVVVKADAGDPRFPRRGLHAIDFEGLSNLLVGFINEAGLCEALGILKWIRFSDMKAEVLTPLPEDRLSEMTELRFGRIRVLESGEELGLLRREEL